MPIYYGNNEIGSVFYGNNEIGEGFYGGNQIYSNAKVISLGNNSSFDVTSIYANYGSLTANNFFILSATTASGANSLRSTSGQGVIHAGFFAGLSKSYNASTGILSCYNYVEGYNDDNGSSPDNWIAGSAGVVAVLIPKPSKLISLGTKTSFNVSSYAGYQNFTNDNFLISSATRTGFSNSFYNQGYTYDSYATCRSIITKSYNASTGVLTAYIRQQSWNTDGTYTTPGTHFNQTNDGTVTVYLLLDA